MGAVPMGKVNSLKPGDFIIPTTTVATLADGISLLPGRKYKVVSWTPKKPIPEFTTERDRYNFYCGQIIPEFYYSGLIIIDFNGIGIALRDTYFIHYL